MPPAVWGHGVSIATHFPHHYRNITMSSLGWHGCWDHMSLAIVWAEFDEQWMVQASGVCCLTVASLQRHWVCGNHRSHSSGHGLLHVAHTHTHTQNRQTTLCLPAIDYCTDSLGCCVFARACMCRSPALVNDLCTHTHCMCTVSVCHTS